jgi:hypothetical protein
VNRDKQEEERQTESRVDADIGLAALKKFNESKLDL